MGDTIYEGMPPQPDMPASIIEDSTGFKLVQIYPGFSEENGFVSPGLLEERERLAEQFGEENVLPSFFTEDKVLQLGLFVRKHS